MTSYFANKNPFVIALIVLVLIGILWLGAGLLGFHHYGLLTRTGEADLVTLSNAPQPSSCTISGTVNGVVTEGSIYVSGGNLRGNFNTVISKDDQRGTSESHMIKKEGVLYIWSDSMPSGATFPEPENAQAADPVSYRCALWLPFTHVFTPPSSVVFGAFSKTPPAP